MESASPPVEVRADDVTLDPQQRSLEARGRVRIDQWPFVLTSSHLFLRREGPGVTARGTGELRVGTCHEGPLVWEFREAILGPPADVVLRGAQGKVGGVPLVSLPSLWLRAPSRTGLRLPRVAWRGDDGVLGEVGVHLAGPGTDASADVQAGAYTAGGAVGQGTLILPTSSTRVRWDHLRSSGLEVDARGATSEVSAAGTVVAFANWDVDMLRGSRAVQATTPLGAAARPWDRGAFESGLRWGPWTLSSTVRQVTVRGGELASTGATGALLRSRYARALGETLLVEATGEAGGVSVPMALPGSGRGAAFGPGVGSVSGDALMVARAQVGAVWAGALGPVALGLTLRGAGATLAAGQTSVGQVQGSWAVSLGLPLRREFGAPGERDPWVHAVEPRWSVRGFSTQGRLPWSMGGAYGFPLEDGQVAATEFAWINQFGRHHRRQGAEVQVAAGVLGRAREASAVGRTRGTLDFPYGGLSVDGALVARGDARGSLGLGRLRVGRRDGLSGALLVATSAGVHPLEARLLAPDEAEPPLAFLGRTGTTLGGRLNVPWSSTFRMGMGIDGDPGDRTLLATRGSLEWQDPCGCVSVGAHVSERIGRGGVDAWVALTARPDLFEMRLR